MTAKSTLKRPHTSQSDLIGDPITDAIRAALEVLIGTLRIAPNGPLTLQPAQSDTFALNPDPESFSILNPLPLGGLLGVNVTVTWQVLKREFGQKVNVAQGTLFDSQSGLNALRPDLAFAPQLLEDRNGAPAFTPFFIRATVTLSVNNPLTGDPITVGPLALPDVEVQLPTLLVPRLLALFRHRNFALTENNKEGFALLVLPTTAPSAMQNPQSASDITGRLTGLITILQPILQRLNGLTATLPSFVDNATALTGFLTGLQALTGALGNFPGIAVEIADAIPNLNTLTLIQRGFFRNDIEAEDEISALIFLGLAGSVELFNKRQFDNDRGALRITLGSNGCAVVPNLHKATPIATIGNATIRVLAPPKVALEENTFGNMMSSVRFVG